MLESREKLRLKEPKWEEMRMSSSGVTSLAVSSGKGFFAARLVAGEWRW